MPRRKNEKLPSLNRAKPKVKPLGAPRAERPSKRDGGPVGQPSSPLNVSPAMKGTERPVRTNFSGGTWNATPEVDLER